MYNKIIKGVSRRHREARCGTPLFLHADNIWLYILWISSLALITACLVMALQVSAAKDLPLFGFLKVIYILQDFLDGGSRSHNDFVYAREGKDREAADLHLWPKWVSNSRF